MHGLCPRASQSSKVCISLSLQWQNEHFESFIFLSILFTPKSFISNLYIIKTSPDFLISIYFKKYSKLNEDLKTKYQQCQLLVLFVLFQSCTDQSLNLRFNCLMKYLASFIHLYKSISQRFQQFFYRLYQVWFASNFGIL